MGIDWFIGYVTRFYVSHGVLNLKAYYWGNIMALESKLSFVETGDRSGTITPLVCQINLCSRNLIVEPEIWRQRISAKRGVPAVRFKGLATLRGSVYRYFAI